MRFNSSPKLTPNLVKDGAFSAEPFSLADVGASGGIDTRWKVFGDSLTAVGFDPLVKEVERLNAEEQNPRIRYRAALIGHRGFDALRPDHPVASNDAFSRSSAARTQELMRQDYAKTYYDQTHEGSVTSELVELDEYFLVSHPSNVDFIKTDTDGHDIEVVLGSKRLLAAGPVLGLVVEASFLGPIHESANLFSNIDIHLRNLGFSLFDLEPARYTRALLPKQFQYRLPANTAEGQMVWADFLYFRDAAIEGYERSWGIQLTPLKLLKLCCLYEMFGFEDCAAEVLVKFRERLQSLADVDHCLNLLTPPLPDGRELSYREYMEVFEKTPEDFYPRTTPPVAALVNDAGGALGRLLSPLLRKRR